MTATSFAKLTSKCPSHKSSWHFDFWSLYHYSVWDIMFLLVCWWFSVMLLDCVSSLFLFCLEFVLNVLVKMLRVIYFVDNRNFSKLGACGYHQIHSMVIHTNDLSTYGLISHFKDHICLIWANTQPFFPKDEYNSGPWIFYY